MLQPRVAHHRARAGFTLTALASQVGISRQALAAVESGRSTPSTALALKLAQVLGCRVEDLFALAEEALPHLLLPSLRGRRVLVGHIDGRWVAHPLARTSTEAADGVVQPDGRVLPTRDPRELQQAVLIAGCAPPLGILAGRIDARWVHAPSGRALDLLRDGQVHVAGIHLAELEDPGAHDALMRSRFPDRPMLVVPFLSWRTGLVSAEPIADPSDLVGMTVGRRPGGSGAERVLERVLAQLPVRPEGPVFESHLEAGTAVLHGRVQVVVTIEPVALALDLCFHPLVEERFELVLPKSRLDHPGVRRMLDALKMRALHQELASLDGYRSHVQEDPRPIR